VVGLFVSVTSNVQGELKARLLDSVISSVTESSGLIVDEYLRGQVLTKSLQSGLNLRAGKLSAAVRDLIATVRGQGDFPQIVADWALGQNLTASQVTPAIRAAMVESLRSMNVDSTNAADLQVYLPLAYTTAQRQAASTSADPIGLISPLTSVDSWNFEVDSFETALAQGVVPNNILAAGVIDYVYRLGEQLNDHLVLRWAAGVVDLAADGISGKLYRYYKLRSQRMQPEERALVYKRVFNLGGEVKVLDNMVANSDFERLWGTHMQEVANYITKAEMHDPADITVSKTPIFQATVDLQHNLTEAASGMAVMQAREMYGQLQDAMDILSDPEIVDQLSAGARKNVWSVIERLSKEELNVVPATASLRTLAVAGNKVFRWIANFDAGAVTEESFQDLLTNGEQWIIATSYVQPAPPKTSDTAPAGSPSGTTPKKDDFSDWDA
jgi:hypothetical protein